MEHHSFGFLRQISNMFVRGHIYKYVFISICIHIIIHILFNIILYIYRYFS